MNGIIRTSVHNRNAPAMLAHPRAWSNLYGRFGMFILTGKKHCSKCGEWKSASEFRPDRRSLGSRISVCNQCRSGGRLHRSKPLVAPTERRCANCHEVKPISAFYKTKDKRGVSAYCRACSTERMTWWAKNNPIKALAATLTGKRNRRALQKNSPGKITTNEWADLKQKHNFTCLCCRRREPEIKLTLDHIVPLACGGSNTIDNAQPLCKSCNSKKHTKIIDYR
jgi:5-methylcytosine-specific restriction endonuclease McrA